MARRRKYTIKKGNKRPKKKARYTPKKRMLDMGRIDSFRWNLSNLLAGLPNPQDKGAIFANICTKSTNIGIDETEKYILNEKEREVIDDTMSERLLKLLDKFSRRR